MVNTLRILGRIGRLAELADDMNIQITAIKLTKTDMDTLTQIPMAEDKEFASVKGEISKFLGIKIKE